jgi:hypothetical protein
MLVKYKYLRTKFTGTVLMQQFYSLNATNFVTRNYFVILLVTYTNDTTCRTLGNTATIPVRFPRRLILNRFTKTSHSFTRTAYSSVFS